MKIWIDADACPGAVKEIVLRAAFRLNLEAIFVANKHIALPQSPLLSAVQVESGPDIADQYICSHAIAGDLVISQDILLASLLVDRDIPVIGVRGDVYDRNTIAERVSTRNLMTELRETGEVKGGPRPFNDQDKRCFASAFDRTLVALLKKNK